MHEFIDNDSYGSGGIPEDRFTFEQISALFHMKYLYHQDPDTPELAGRALEYAKEDVRILEYEISLNEEAEARREEEVSRRQLGQFFEDFNDGFIRLRKQEIDVQVGVGNYDNDPANLSHYGAEFSEVESFTIRAMRLAVCENPAADEGEIVREGRITAGEMLLETGRERRELDERMLRIFGQNDGFLLRHVLSDSALGPPEA